MTSVEKFGFYKLTTHRFNFIVDRANWLGNSTVSLWHEFLFSISFVRWP